MPIPSAMRDAPPLAETASNRVLFAAIVALAIAPAWASDPPKSKPRPAAETALDYRIGPEDLLQISVWNNEPLSRAVTVRPDGKISLPLVNDVPAAGLTPLELREQIAGRLVEYVPAAEVSVIVVEVKSFKVSVIGDVHRPGRFEIKSWCTVADVLAMAGGLTEYADKSRIVVLRDDGRVVRRIPFDYGRLASGDGERINFRVQPNDIVLVP